MRKIVLVKFKNDVEGQPIRKTIGFSAPDEMVLMRDVLAILHRDLDPTITYADILNCRSFLCDGKVHECDVDYIF